MKALLLSLALLSGLPAAAQVYYIDLSDQPLAVPGRTFYIKQVVDGRVNRAGIGTVRRGMGNVPQPAELKPSVVGGLQALLAARLPAQPADRPVLAVVRNLRVQERISLTAEQATDDVALDFYLLDAAGQAHFALSTNETVSSKGLETTARHPRQLAQALQTCLAQLGTVAWDEVAAQPGVAPDQLPAGRLAPTPAYPVLADSARRAGFYRTFVDFRNNSPIAAPALLVEATPNARRGWEGLMEYQPYLQLPGGGRGEPLREAWGFSDGQQLYIYHRKKYRLLTRQGNDFSFVGASEADPGAVSTAGALGGLLGASIAAANTSGQPISYTLHLLSGRVTALAGEDANASADTVRLHIYSRKSSLLATPQPVYLNGAPVGQLAENQVVTVPYTDHLHEVRLRLGSAAGPELVFQPDFQAPVYVKVARNATDPAKPPLEVVPAKVGTFDLRLIKPEPGTY